MSADGGDKPPCHIDIRTLQGLGASLGNAGHGVLDRLSVPFGGIIQPSDARCVPVVLHTIADCDVIVSHAPASFRTTNEGLVPVYPDSIIVHLVADSATFLTLANGSDLMSNVFVPVPQGIHVSSTDTISLFTFANTIDVDTLNDNESGEMEMTAVWSVDKLGSMSSRTPLGVLY